MLSVSHLILILHFPLQQIIQSLVSQLGVDSAHANISTSTSVSVVIWSQIYIIFIKYILTRIWYVWC